MASANQTDENFFEMYKRLIAEKNAENEALKANLEKEKAANDRMEREYAGLELKIALSKSKYKFLTGNQRRKYILTIFVYLVFFVFFGKTKKRGKNTSAKFTKEWCQSTHASILPLV